MTRQILVTGANGRVGGRAAQALIEHGVRPRLLVRDETAARRRFGDAADLCRGDLADTAAVSAAVTGIDAILLCSPVHPEQTRLQGNVVRAAQAEDAYIVKVSGLGTFADSPVDSGAWHAATEAQIRAANLNFTFLRPDFFMQNLLFQLPAARQTGVLKSAVGDTPIAMIDVDDLGDVAATLLLDPGLAAERTLTVSEGVSRTYADVASVMGEVLGREVRYEEQSAEEVETNLRASGQPDWHIQLLLQFNRAFRDGLGADPASTVRDILGRAPHTLPEVLSRDAARAAGGDDPFPS